MSTAVETKSLPGQFIPPELAESAGDIDRQTADALAFGAVRVDDTGRIVLYNRYEADLAGIEPPAAEGRNFFTEVAPCTNNALFYGQFKKGVNAGNLNLIFNYTFSYKMRPTNVRVHMLRDPASKANWVFVKKP
jgi:photoactive yellow protein